MRRQANVGRGLAAALLVGVLVAGHGAAATPRPPSLQLVRATLDRGTRTVDLRLRICFSAGPRAAIAVSERRTVDGVERASARWTVPQGVKPTGIRPFACRTGWRVNWLLKGGLGGPGAYEATVRVRDAYGRWTPRISFGATSP